ncbi:zinc finger MYND domain-containing protein [Phanerochaete sordida]|uniref:Zinc finger MYND domain-containing protein n=1 Tax=Phanerochaete sordida TaxID=48140 RepID=A0A9P3GE28_9APHY|nr:zinc finger MYND domain-containing protein [Phanerochaete sordida]
METILYIVLDNYLCGFSKDDLIRSVNSSVDANRVNAYLVGAIGALQRTLSCCALALTDDPTSASASQIRRISRHAYSQLYSLWQRLWEIKEPFLDSQPKTEGSRYEEVWYATVLVAEEAMLFQYESGDAIVAGSRLSHLAVALWIYRPRGFKAEVSTVLLHIWNHVRQDPNSDIAPAYAKFYNEILAESTITAGDIARTFARDFTKMDGAGTMQKLLDALNGLRPRHDIAYDMRTGLQREVLYRSLAACRDLLCAEHSTSFHELKVVFSVQLVFTINSLHDSATVLILIPERQIHSIIALINAHMVDAMDAMDCAYVSYCSRLASVCRTRLRQLFPDGDQSVDRDVELDAIRQRSLSDSQKNLERMRARGWDSDGHWSRTVLGWKVLGMVLNRLVVSHKSSEPVFAPLARCTWKECLCNVHAPNHKMRICKGCQRVAYCNVGCQEKDWVTGSHKIQCRKPGLDIQQNI